MHALRSDLVICEFHSHRRQAPKITRPWPPWCDRATFLSGIRISDYAMRALCRSIIGCVSVRWINEIRRSWCFKFAIIVISRRSSRIPVYHDLYDRSQDRLWGVLSVLDPPEKVDRVLLDFVSLLSEIACQTFFSLNGSCRS